MNGALDLLQAALRGEAGAASDFDFALPSAMSADQLAALSGATTSVDRDLHHEH